MKGNHSTTKLQNLENLPDEEIKLTKQWDSIDWHKVKTSVNNLQTRIAKAIRENKTNKAKRLGYLLTHSMAAKLLAVNRVTSNKGKRTPGIDNEIWNSPALKMRNALLLTDKGYKSKPLKRVFIEKKGKKTLRPLGIPTMYDRSMQALYALALEPIAETTADTHSFGFRIKRCAQDAMAYIHGILSHHHSSRWILEGDIHGCFDAISHLWLIDNIPMDKTVLKQFLKSGFIYQDKLFQTTAGTPQGGIISPILANMTLDGIQNLLKQEIPPKGVQLIRYADDFIVTAPTKEIAERAKKLIEDFFKTRGLELSQEKTLITRIEDGFDFIGWNFRKFNDKLIIQPSAKSIKSVLTSFALTIKRNCTSAQDDLIKNLNPIIRGWSNYHRATCAKKIFSKIDHQLFILLWKWASRRHSKKGKQFIMTRYWHNVNGRKWTFVGDKDTLISMGLTKIIRHPKLTLTMNPYLDVTYFITRKYKLEFYSQCCRKRCCNA